MPPDRDLFGHLDRQLVNPLEARRDKDRETLVLMAPEFFVLDQPSRRCEQGLDIRRPPLGAETLRCLAQQVAQPDRILADFAAGLVGRQIDRDRRLRLAGEQLVQVVSEEHDRPRNDKFCLPNRVIPVIVP